MSDEAPPSTEIEAVMCRLDTIVGGGLEAGADPFVVAAACIWTGVKETIALTSPECAAAALRTIAGQIDPPAIVPGEGRPAARSRDAARRVDPHADRKPTSSAIRSEGFAQDIAGDVVDEAVDLIDRGHVPQARALLMALRSRLVQAVVGRAVMRRGEPRAHGR
jgi:hypothetical protein